MRIALRVTNRIIYLICIVYFTWGKAMFLKHGVYFVVISVFIVNAMHAGSNEGPYEAYRNENGKLDNIEVRYAQIADLSMIREDVQRDLALLHSEGLTKEQEDRIATFNLCAKIASLNKIQDKVDSTMKRCIRLDDSAKEPKCAMGHLSVAQMYSEYVAKKWAETIRVEGSPEHKSYELQNKIVARASRNSHKLPYIN